MEAEEQTPRSLLAAVVEGALAPGIVVLTLLIPLPMVTGVSDVSSAVLGSALSLIGCGVAVAQRPAVRRFALSLFIWSFALRLLVLLLLSAVPGYDRAALLGPDSTGYYRGSQILAAGGLPAGRTPIEVFGSTDIAHYYLFAGVLRAFHVDLFGLQLLNGALSALTALVSFLWCKVVLPPYAALTGVVVACAPTLIAMSVTDLLKDPSIILATVVALWAIARLLEASPALVIAGWGLLAVAALTYLRMDRFYVAAYLEAAFALVVLVLLARRVKLPPAPIAGLLLVVLAAEVLPMAAGWPSSPEGVISNLIHVEQSPQIRDPTPGIVSGTGPNASNLPPVLREAISPLAPVTDIFRRMYGPFIWIAPPDLSAATIFGGNYPLYPGMLLWYALIPLMLVGVAVVLWRSAALRTTEIVLPAVAVFLAVYLAQYLAINLSYRQREDVFPLLFVFVPIGLAFWSGLRYPRFYYGAYCLVLVLIAAAHLAIIALA